MKRLESSGTPIYFDSGLTPLKELLSTRSYSKVFLLTDENTSVYCLPVFQQLLDGFSDFDLIETSAGEECKTIDFCIGIWKTLLEFEADRKSLLINLGGGVITDMGGFIASTYKRGIDFINIPTSILAQVDASVGGKTGIDLDHAKNMIGTFNLPIAVYIESGFLTTLPDREGLSGFAELLKHGLIADREYFDTLSQSQPHEVTSAHIFKSVQIKNSVVEQDPFEKGIRKILNFGHTIGHAIESYSLLHDSSPLTHGEAIAIGMICEAFLSVNNSTLQPSELERISSVIGSFYPKNIIKEAAFKDLIGLMVSDKKNENGQILFSLLPAIGNCAFNCRVAEKAILDSFSYYNFSLQ